MFLGTFLQSASLTDNELGFLFGLIAAFFFLFLLVLVFAYVYLSFAYSAVAKKAKLRSPGIAWIPFVGPLIIAYKTSKMHWWPWLLIIGFFIPIVNVIANLVFTVFTVIWHWKMFESIKKPNWWSILMLIPIVNFVIIGIAAWSKK